MTRPSEVVGQSFQVIRNGIKLSCGFLIYVDSEVDHRTALPRDFSLVLVVPEFPRRYFLSVIVREVSNQVAWD